VPACFDDFPRLDLEHPVEPGQLVSGEGVGATVGRAGVVGLDASLGGGVVHVVSAVKVLERNSTNFCKILLPLSNFIWSSWKIFLPGATRSCL
jgi:hypothetical protein